MEKAANRPKIGLLSCIAFAVGTMIGAGVFVLSGPAIDRVGPAALISYGTAGVCVLFSALSFSVVASMAPAGASGYAYVRTVFGAYWGFITSWAFYISGIIGCAFILNGFGTYFQQFFVPTSNALTISLIAAAGLTLLNMGPASLIGKAEIFLVGIKILALLLLIGFGLYHFHPAEMRPFDPHGWNPVFHESGQLFIAFLGFSVICSMAGDVKNAPRNIPLAILLSMLIVAVIYFGIVLALLAAKLPEYTESSIGTAANALMGEYGKIVISIAALVSILSCANANILGSSETMVRLAGKGEVPTILGKMYGGHPLASVLIGAVVYFALMLLGKSEAAVSYTNVCTITMLLLVNLAAFKALRKKLVYKSIYPFSMGIPALGFLAGLAQLFLIDIKDVAIGLIFVFAGSIFFIFRKQFQNNRDHHKIKEHMRVNDGPASRALKDTSLDGIKPINT
jgi:APA family basic amino acid/polyamine antiporter